MIIDGSIPLEKIMIKIEIPFTDEHTDDMFIEETRLIHIEKIFNIHIQFDERKLDNNKTSIIMTVCDNDLVTFVSERPSLYGEWEIESFNDKWEPLSIKVSPCVRSLRG